MAVVAVVGGGVGGLAAAIRLALTGHDVTVYERNARVGGKLDGKTIDGFAFDTGPSLLTLPHVFRELFELAGEDLNDHLSLVRLETICRYTFPTGDTIEFADGNGEGTAAALGSGGAEFLRFMTKAKRMWEVSERTFFAGAMDSPMSMFKRMKSPRDLAAIDPLRTLDALSSKFEDPRLRLWLNRYATYSGSSPYSAPATLACIPYIEQRYGAWHVEGGLNKLADALAALAARVGVKICVGTDVTKVMESRGRVNAISVGGEMVPVDAVLANCDAEYLYETLLPNTKALDRTAKAGRSSSGFALLLGVEGTTPGLSHHNIWFSKDQRREFGQIFGGFSRFGQGIADDPTTYVCCSVKSDKSQSPAGTENWFVLVNVGAGASGDWSAYQQHLIERLGLQSRVRFVETITPSDLAEKYRVPGGAIYGSSSNGKRSAFLRAGNRGPVNGLYLAGGSSHPGGGLPLVAMSGAIAADMIQKDFL